MPKSKLRTLTVQFKKDALALMLRDGMIAKTVVPKIPLEMFESVPEYAEIFDELKKFVIKFGSRPRNRELHQIIKSECLKAGIEKDKIKLVLRAHKDLVNHKNFTPQYVREQLYDAVVVHKLTEAVDKAPDLLDQGEYDKFVQTIASARSCVAEDGPLVEYWSDTDDRLKRRSEQQRQSVIPTGLEKLDMMLGGGLPRGKLGIVIASSGKGKSAILSNFAYHASKSQYDVAITSYELDADSIMSRFDSIATDIPLRELGIRKNRVSNRVLNEFTSNMPGSLFVRFRPTKSESVSDIRRYIEEIRNNVGVIPDALFVDYFDLLRMEGKYQNRYEALEENMELLRGLAGEFNFALWTASQTNRGALKKDEVGAEDIASAYGKIFPADLVLTVGQTQKEASKQVIRIHVEKSRFCTVGDDVWISSNFEKMKLKPLSDAEVQAQGYAQGLKYSRTSASFGAQP